MVKLKPKLTMVNLVPVTTITIPKLDHGQRSAALRPSLVQWPGIGTSPCPGSHCDTAEIAVANGDQS